MYTVRGSDCLALKQVADPSKGDDEYLHPVDMYRLCYDAAAVFQLCFKLRFPSLWASLRAFDECAEHFVRVAGMSCAAARAWTPRALQA